jgi:hypothetical protein
VPTVWIAFRLKGHVRRPGGRRVVGADRAPPPRPANAAAPGPSGATSLTLPADAVAVGRTLAELNLRARTGISVVAVARGDGDAVAPSALEPLREGDVLALAGPSERIAHALDLLLSGEAPKPTTPGERRLVLAAGLGVLLFVPVFKVLTHLPPVMGILLGLGALWLLTEVLHKGKNDERRGALSVGAALQRVDAPSVLFFLGILLAVGALEAHGDLGRLATWMDRTIRSTRLITLAIGLSSSIVDNIPLVAAAQGMYPRSVFPTDHGFWRFLAYCAGTGGSIFIIGSAAGIAVMGSERISFGWYLRRLSLPALLGYAAGAAVYLATAAIAG